MENALFYIPTDRRQAMLQGAALPEYTTGVVLFADISGFTPLTNALVAEFGPRRGADELTRQLNAIYNALIAAVDRFGGSVINFSGDGITCWFGQAEQQTSQMTVAPAQEQLVQATLCALTSALAMQQAMSHFATLELDYGVHVQLAIKTAIVAGRVRRILVGNPDIQLIDVLAGATLDRVAATEQMTQKGEVVLDAETVASIAQFVRIHQWRTNAATGARYGVVDALHVTVQPSATSHSQCVLDESQVRPWVLPVVYQRLLSEQGRFLAELRPATALFLRFEGLEYDQDEVAGSKLDAYVCWVQKVVNYYEGSLIQLTTGDKGSYLYAAFGAPITHDDDTRRAIAAALELRTPPPQFPFIASTQIGLSQGLMRVGAYGSDTRRTYGVLGEETAIAARLMVQAAPGQVLVSEPVAEAAADAYQLLDLGWLKLKGKAEPQHVQAVLGPRPRTDERLSHLHAAPLVGRSTELDTLRQTLTPLFTGQGQLLRIEGNAGIGKSHLTAHFVEQARAHGIAIAVAACQSTSQHVAYFAVRQLARTLLGLTNSEAQGEAAQLAQISTAISQTNAAWLVRMPLLGELLGLPIPDNPTTAAFDPRLRQEALTSLVVEMIQTHARQQPLLLLCEDVHWIDEASQGLLLALARVIANAPILLLLVHRPPVRDHEPFLTELATLPNQTYLPLDELAPAGIAALVHNRLGGPITPLALSLIQAQAQGNPFFTEELLDALIDATHLVAVEQVWTLSATLERILHNAGCLKLIDNEWKVAPDAPLAAVELGIPTTIHGIILARLDRLPESVKLTVKVASVIGRVFDFALLAQAHPGQSDTTVLAQHLETLLRRDFARLETPAPRLSYIFKHNITQEVVYQTLLEDQVYELHQAVAQHLEKSQPEKIEDLAFHFYNADLRRAEVRVKALHYLASAGSRAQRDYANETALNYFNRALLLDERWEWLKAKIEILHILGRREEEYATLSQLARVPNTSEFAAALLWGEYYEAVSDYAQAQSVLQWALTLAQAAGDAEGEARCFARLGMIAWRQGDYDAAEQDYTQALKVIQDEERFRDEEAEARYGLGLVYRQQGKYDEAQVQFEGDLSLNRQLVNRQNEARALNALGNLAHLRRHFTQAIHDYQAALEIRQSIGDRTGIGSSLFSIAQGLGNKGDHSLAEPLLYEALKIQQTINNRWWETLIWNELGILNFMVGRFDTATHCLANGLQICQETGNESSQSYILCNLGQVLRDQEKFSEAELVLQDGLRMTQKQGDVNLEAIYYSDLALLKLRTRQFAEAIQYAQTSLEILRSLDILLSTTTDLTILAAGYLGLGDQPNALTYTDETLAILAQCDGEGPDFPQRDYWMCYQILQAAGEPARAEQALAAAHRLLMQQAARISDPKMRTSYLENVPFNQSIIQAAASLETT